LAGAVWLCRQAPRQVTEFTIPPYPAANFARKSAMTLTRNHAHARFATYFALAMTVFMSSTAESRADSAALEKEVRRRAAAVNFLSAE
jgi:hypothetical protein